MALEPMLAGLDFTCMRVTYLWSVTETEFWTETYLIRSWTPQPI